MKKRKLTLALALFLCLTLCLSACGSSGKSTAASGSNNAPMESAAPEAPAMDYGDGGIYEQDAPGASGGGYYENTKIIRTADLSLESTDFDAAVESLNTLVKAQKGYFESSNFSYGGYNSGRSRWAEFTVRVPQESFDPFLEAVGDVAHVTSRNTGIQDVGEAYYDAELHLKTLNTKHERLLKLLEKAELMEDIIALESALSDVEYQIQQYKSTLTRYDALINYSTIQIDLREVVRVSDTPTEADPLSARIGSAFARGWHNFCDGLADLAVWCAYNFFGLLIFLAVVALAAMFLSRLSRRRRNRRGIVIQTPQEEPKDETK